MTHFPMFYNLCGREILIFGGGRLARERMEKLLPFGAKLTVISETVCDEILTAAGVTVIERPFEPSDLDSRPILAIIAESPEPERIYEECRKRHIPVNAVDQPRYCDILFPSVVCTEHLCIGISSGGISPTATVSLKEQIARVLPDHLDSILEWMPYAKEQIKQCVPRERQKAVLRAVFEDASVCNRPLTAEELLPYLSARK